MTRGKMTKEELREDKVLTAITEMGQSFKKNAIAIVSVIVLIVAALVVVQVVRSGRDRAEREASLLLLDGETIYRSNGAAEALPRFVEAGERYSGSVSGKIGLLRAGDCMIEIGAYEDARVSYERFLDAGLENGLLQASALRGLAAVSESLERYEEAAAQFLTAAEVEGNPLRADDIVRAARAWLDAGQVAEAEEAYRSVMERFPDHPKVREAREGLAEARALSGS